jgi:thiamine biosynthesis protein ThiI
VAVEVGSAILAANENISVDLNEPDLEVFVEVRHKRTFIFSGKITGPGGFPVGTQGRALALVTDKKSVYAAWLMMKRGCTMKLMHTGSNAQVYARKLKEWYLASQPSEIAEECDVLEVLPEMAKKNRAEALVLGYTADEFENEPRIEAEIPVFYPLIGMSHEDIERGVTFLFSDGS